jgi:hypothetical protein
VSEVDDTSIVETKHYKSNNLNEMSSKYYYYYY